MVQIKQLEKEIEKIGAEFIALSKEDRELNNSAWQTCRNKLSARLWKYAKKFRQLKYRNIDEYDFEDSISVAIIECLQDSMKSDIHSWIGLFKFKLKNEISKTTKEESNRGISEINKKSIELGRKLEQWAIYKGLSYDISKYDSKVEAKLYEYGHTWGKSDKQIKKALDLLFKKHVIDGDQKEKFKDDDSETTKLDLLKSRESKNKPELQQKEDWKSILDKIDQIFQKQKDKEFLSKVITYKILKTLTFFEPKDKKDDYIETSRTNNVDDKNDINFYLPVSFDLKALLESYSFIDDKLLKDLFEKGLLPLQDDLERSKGSVNKKWNQFKQKLLKKYGIELKELLKEQEKAKTEAE